MPQDCTTANLYDSLRFCDGNVVIPGIRRRVYYIPKSNIVSYPTLPDVDADGASMGSIATYVGNFVLAADSKFKYIDIDDASSNVDSESQGEMYSRTFLNKATFKHPGKAEEATGFARMANNSDLLFLYQERSGKFRVLGNDKFTTNVKPAQNSGAKETDASGTTLSIEVSDVCPAPFYTGEIPLDSGVLNTSTCEITREATTS